MAAAALPRYAMEFPEAKAIYAFPGAGLVGRNYEPMLPYFKDTESAFRVLAGDFVTAEDGAGLVHMAPGFGEDDLAALPPPCRTIRARTSSMKATRASFATSRNAVTARSSVKTRSFTPTRIAGAPTSP